MKLVWTELTDGADTGYSAISYYNIYIDRSDSNGYVFLQTSNDVDGLIINDLSDGTTYGF